jgi:hypothetical protein
VVGFERVRAAWGPLRLRAHWLAIDPATHEADAADVRVTPCPCAEAPVRLDARSAHLAPNGDLRLSRTTLQLGDVPVLWLPVMLVRTGREPALLPPEIGFRGDDGLLLGTGAYVPVGPADVEVRGRWATAGRLEARAAAELPAAHADVAAFRGDARVRARGHTGPLAFEVDRATDPRIVDRLESTLPEAAREPLHSAVYVALPLGDVATVSTGATVHGDAGAAPRLAASAGGPLGWSHLLGRTSVLADRDVSTGTERADAASAVEVRGAGGPVRLGAEIGARATAWRGEDDAARVVAGGAADARLPLERRYGALRHEVSPGIALRTIAAERASGKAPGVDDRDRISPRARADASFESRLDGSEGEIAQGSIVASVSDHPFGSAEGSVGPVTGAAAWDPDPGVATLLEVGASVSPGALDVDLGWRRIRPGASPLTVEDASAFAGADPFALARPAEEAWGGVGVRWPLGIRTGAEARYDLVARTASWMAARLGWSARCRCLSVDAVASRRAGRDLPEAFVSVTLY